MKKSGPVGVWTLELSLAGWGFYRWVIQVHMVDLEQTGLVKIYHSYGHLKRPTLKYIRNMRRWPICFTLARCKTSKIPTNVHKDQKWCKPGNVIRSNLGILYAKCMFKPYMIWSLLKFVIFEPHAFENSHFYSKVQFVILSYYFSSTWLSKYMYMQNNFISKFSVHPSIEFVSYA